MKKLVALFLSLALVLSCALIAMAEEPGQKAYVTISLDANPDAAIGGQIRFKFNTDVLTFVSADSSYIVPTTFDGAFILSTFSGSGLPTGPVGTIEFLINENAPAGVYYVTASAHGFEDAEENSVNDTVKVSGGKVTVTRPACDCTYDDGVVTTEADCENDGVKTYTCTKCNATKTEVIPAIGHDWDEGTVTTKPTCKDAGVETYTCANCNKTNTKEIAATGEHTWDAGTVKTKPDCTNEGVTVFTCVDCGETDETTVPPTGHTPSDSAVRVEPTCTAEGSISYNCTACGVKVEGEILPPTGHDWDNGVETTKPACGKEGVKTYTCTNNCGETKTEAIAALEHSWDAGVETTKPACGKEGVKIYTCANCKETKTEAIAALKHVAGEWVVVKEATKEEDGLKELRCTECNELLDSQKIKSKSIVYYPNNTACSVGPCFREESKLTDKWYRFTPVDLSVDGTYVYDLVASNLYIIGEVKVTVADGTVTVECDYASNGIVVDSEFCTFLPSLAETTTLDQNELKNYPFGEPISIENDLAGDTKVLLFICNVVDYNSGMRVEHLQYKTKAFQLEMEELKKLMD